MLAEVDLLAPLPDISMLLGDGIDLGSRRSASVTMDWGTQSLITDTIDRARSETHGMWDDDLELGLDHEDVNYTSIIEVE